ncbi:RNA methyltransferase [Bacillus salacetis]|uniref:RNA methyltransferase n=1 Tax=Bacillus salacetis TaxID=2315464 RepID=A0A3A1QM92_9BACI|nr:RsmD family RNA methyltransferase [Bacillus salacetis]RIW27810.1 RNA methyltransferase [Bacillus salacetis]
MRYIYNYAWDKNERSLCKMEMRALFGKESNSSILESPLKVDPSRSPFIRERIEVLCEGETLNGLAGKVRELPAPESAFKVIYVKDPIFIKEDRTGFEERRKAEREIGMNIKGKADLHHPKILYGIKNMNGRWIFGKYVKNEAIWLKHQQKPNSYSTALSTRVARAVVNIAAPDPAEKKVIDPCCGIGTVLVEALSMGIDIVGSDINPLIIPGAKENIKHFNLQGQAEVRDIRCVKGSYDAAIIDLPYNLCSVITPSEQLEMLQSARRFTKRLVIVTVEDVDSVIEQAGFRISDRCVVTKGNFRREVILCV